MKLFAVLFCLALMTWADYSQAKPLIGNLMEKLHDFWQHKAGHEIDMENMPFHFDFSTLNLSKPNMSHPFIKFMREHCNFSRPNISDLREPPFDLPHPPFGLFHLPPPPMMLMHFMHFIHKHCDFPEPKEALKKFHKFMHHIISHKMNKNKLPFDFDFSKFDHAKPNMSHPFIKFMRDHCNFTRPNISMEDFDFSDMHFPHPPMPFPHPHFLRPLMHMLFKHHDDSDDSDSSFHPSDIFSSIFGDSDESDSSFDPSDIFGSIFGDSDESDSSFDPSDIFGSLFGDSDESDSSFDLSDLLEPPFHLPPPPMALMHFIRKHCDFPHPEL